MSDDTAALATPAENDARFYDSLSESQLRELLISAHKQIYGLQLQNQHLWETWRDEHAKAALPAIVASALADGITWRRTPQEIAEAAFKIADAMLAQRAKGSAEGGAE